MTTAPHPLTQLRGLTPLLDPLAAFAVLDALDAGTVQVVTDHPDRRVWGIPRLGAIGLHRPTGTLLVDLADGTSRHHKPGRTTPATWTDAA